MQIINLLLHQSTDGTFEVFENVIMAQDYHCSNAQSSHSQNETFSTMILEYTDEGDLCKEEPGSFWSTQSTTNCTQVSSLLSLNKYLESS